MLDGKQEPELVPKTKSVGGVSEEHKIYFVNYVHDKNGFYTLI